MKRKSLCVVVGLAMFAVAHSASAQQGYSRLTFVGAVVQGACNSSVPPLGVPSGMGGCGAAAGVHAVYAENTVAARAATGIAMLDYFAGRPDGGNKLVVTRQYR